MKNRASEKDDLSFGVSRQCRLGLETNGFGFNITGTTNMPIVVEACNNLSGSPWSPLMNGTLTNGMTYFSDFQWKNHPRRFYRIRSP